MFETTTTSAPTQAEDSTQANNSQASSGLAARTEGATKVYGEGETEVRAIDDITVGIKTGELTAIMGPSGSGKSTLMHCMAGLDSLTSGRAFIGDVELTRLKERQLTLLRRENVGFIFQSFNLIPTLTASENITLPLSLAGSKPDEEWFEQIVGVVNLKDRLDHRPTELSGGQQQRVAVARALLSRPTIIFGDEPTGNLDSTSSGEILKFIREVVDELGQTIVMVTHDPRAASISDRLLLLRDGKLEDELQNPTFEEIQKRT